MLYRCMGLLLCLLLLTGCAEEAQSKTFFAMDTVMAATVYGGDEDILDQVQQEVGRLERLFSVTDEKSEIYAVNSSGSGELSPETAQLIASALELSERTGGALDITVYPILKEWGFTTDIRQKPEEAQLEALLPLVDHSRVELKGREIALPEDMKIDLGAIAKGYTGDRLAALLKEAGVNRAILDLGGNVQLIGGNAEGGGWRVGVGHPNGREYLGVLTLTDKALVTSGGYQRYFEEDGTLYHHIIDPASGYPANAGLQSVTVAADSGLIADGLSTALYVMGLDKAIDLWRQSDDFEAVFYTDAGQLYITEGLADCFAPEAIEPVILRRES